MSMSTAGKMTIPMAPSLMNDQVLREVLAEKNQGVRLSPSVKKKCQAALANAAQQDVLQRSDMAATPAHKNTSIATKKQAPTKRPTIRGRFARFNQATKNLLASVRTSLKSMVTSLKSFLGYLGDRTKTVFKAP